MASKKHLREIEAIVAGAGFSIEKTSTAHNHIKLRVRLDGEPRVIVAPATPSDYRSMLNFRATVRRIARDIKTRTHPVVSHHPLGKG